MKSYDDGTCANVAGYKIYYYLIVRYGDAPKQSCRRWVTIGYDHGTRRTFDRNFKSGKRMHAHVMHLWWSITFFMESRTCIHRWQVTWIIWALHMSILKPSPTQAQKTMNWWLPLIDQPPPNINRLTALMCLDQLQAGQRQLETESDQSWSPIIRSKIAKHFGERLPEPVRRPHLNEKRLVVTPTVRKDSMRGHTDNRVEGQRITKYSSDATQISRDRSWRLCLLDKEGYTNTNHLRESVNFCV
jgi:hypothetical protein